jgi:hypothetical protein
MSNLTHSTKKYKQREPEQKRALSYSTKARQVTQSNSKIMHNSHTNKLAQSKDTSS